MAHNQFELLRQRRFLPFFVVQSLGAFNDNVFRQAIIGLLFWLGISEDQRSLYTNLAPALFILPYFLFSATAGQFAEKLEKSQLIRITTAMEIGIMSLAGIGFMTQSLPLLLACLFLTGVQSTLFGPVKYSILPSVLKPEELTGGNGLVEMGTSISILAGMIFGGLIFALAGSQGPLVATTALVVLAVSGNLVSRLIPSVDAGAPETKVNWIPIVESLAVLRLARKQVAVRNAILGISWFWFFGTVLTAQQRDAVWQMFSPNKALGLTGVRAAYAIAPVHAQAAAHALDVMAPSWVLGAHGVAMLQSWALPATQGWVMQSLDTLRQWKQHQVGALENAGWTVMPSNANFFCARPPEGRDLPTLLATLRAHGIKLRDATSFGLPGWVRLGVLPPMAVDALIANLHFGD